MCHTSYTEPFSGTWFQFLTPVFSVLSAQELGGNPVTTIKPACSALLASKAIVGKFTLAFCVWLQKSWCSSAESGNLEIQGLQVILQYYLSAARENCNAPYNGSEKAESIV